MGGMVTALEKKATARAETLEEGKETKAL